MKKLLWSCLLLLPALLPAQHRLGLHFMPWTYQSTLTNPAIAQPARFQLTLPVPLPTMGADFYHSGFRLRDLVEDPTAAVLTLTPERALAAMPAEGVLRLRTEVLLLATSLRLGNWQVGLHLSNHNEFLFGYARDLISLGIEGLAPHRGERLQLAPELGFTHYHQVAASVSRSLGEKWRFGARLKLLGGVLNVSSLPGQNRLEVYPYPNSRDLSVDLDYTLQSSSSLNLGVDHLLALAEGQGTGFQAEGLMGLSNPGWGVDLGVQYEPIKNLVISASVVDLGQISWQNMATVYRAQGSYTYDGLPGFTENGGINLSDPAWQHPAEAWSVMADSMRGRFSFGQEATAYTTALPARGYLSAQYRLLRILSLGLAWTGEVYQATPNHTVSGWAGLHLGRWLTFGLNYSYDQRYDDMLGVHGRVNLGPMQFYASAGNIMPLIDPYGTQAMSFILGSNYTFGRKRD